MSLGSSGPEDSGGHPDAEEIEVGGRQDELTDSSPDARDGTRRDFLIRLAKVTAFAPPVMLTLKGEPLNAQANVYQAWANYFQALANFYAAQGAVGAANYYQFWSNYLQALANQVAAQQGLLSPRNAPVLDPNLQPTPDESADEPWHRAGPAAPPPWAAQPPGSPPAPES